MVILHNAPGNADFIRHYLVALVDAGADHKLELAGRFQRLQNARHRIQLIHLDLAAVLYFKPQPRSTMGEVFDVVFSAYNFQSLQASLTIIHIVLLHWI